MKVLYNKVLASLICIVLGLLISSSFLVWAKNPEETPKTNISAEKEQETEEKKQQLHNDVHAEEDGSIAHETLQALAQEINSKKKVSNKDKTKLMVSINYANEELVDIINDLAEHKKVNVILPQGANAITQKVTFSLPEKIDLDRAWSLLYTLLDIAGYTLMPKENMYEITKNSPNISREPLPLYIGIAPDKLPDTDQRIRYIYYLSNVKVSDAPDSETVAILQNLLPLATSSFKIDPTTNGIIINAKANDIRGVMQIILDLDKIEYQETMAFVKLHYTTARNVADLFNEKILKANADTNRYHLAARQQTEVSFFSKYIRIIPEDRTNNVILLGRPQAVERVRDFIQTYVDIQLEEGKSTLHVYQLQYLDADQMATVLTNIINASRTGGTDQSRVAAGVTPGAIRLFDEVIIKSDKPANAADSKYYGSNKLVVAARNDDWKVIERLITELDIPQPQVLLEILVVDLTAEDIRKLGTQLRNPARLPMPGTSSAQSAQIAPPIGNATVDPATLQPSTLASDLLRPAFTASTASPACAPNGNVNTLADCFIQEGATAISFNDPNGSTWGVMQILRSISSTKVLSNPHVITINNKQASLYIGQTRLLTDEAVGSGGTTTTIKNKLIPAYLSVKITPRISAANTVLLDVFVDVSNYQSTTDNTILNRNVTTSAIVKDQSILALGGLIKTSDNDTLAETPILGKVPILGWFFKNRGKDVVKNNLTVFISPTIIQPRLRSGASEYTKDYINLAKSYAHQGSLFDSLHDPVTRWYFKTGNDAGDITDQFLDKDELKRDIQTSTKPNPRKVQDQKEPTVVDHQHEQADEKKPKKERKMFKLEEMLAKDDGDNPLLTSDKQAIAA